MLKVIGVFFEGFTYTFIEEFFPLLEPPKVPRRLASGNSYFIKLGFNLEVYVKAFVILQIM